MAQRRHNFISGAAVLALAVAVGALAFRAAAGKDDEDKREILRFLSRELQTRPAQ